MNGITRIRESAKDKIFVIVNVIIMLAIAISIVYPLYFIVVASVCDPDVANAGGLLLYPPKLYFDGFNKIFTYSPLWTGYYNSLLYTVVGTLVNIVVTIPCAYALSRKDLVGRTPIMFLFTFTMFFSGGLIPTYLVVMKLGLLNTMWAMILPCAASVWNIIIARTFFQSNIPDEMLEAAKIDGCTNMKFFFHIVLPLSGTITAVMILFYGVSHWNSFFDALIYLNSDNKQPLQIVLRNLLIINQIGSQMLDDPSSAAAKQRIAEQMKYGIIVVSSLPLMIAYPFVQKHFAKGVMIGAIKG